MQRKHIVVNTIAFVDQVQQGTEQRAFFEEVAKLGIQHVEVRQEYFSRTGEFDDTAREASKHGLKLLYSVPKQLFQNGQLDRAMVEQTFHEVSELSAIGVKWTRGDFKGWSSEDREWLTTKAELLPTLLTVENDQSEQDGRLNNYFEFLAQSGYGGVPLYSTFDIGNWAWVGEDPLHTARELASFVRYIHVKDVKFYSGTPEAVALGNGALPLKAVFAELPKNVLVALEYPCGREPLAELQKGIDWLENTIA